MGNILTGINLTIKEEGDDIVVSARCRKNTTAYLLAILDEYLRRYESVGDEEERARPAPIKRK